MRVHTVVVIASFVMALPASAQTWRSYFNARFGVTADVPADWRAGRPPDNNDGLAFTSPDRQSTITVSGILNIDDTLAEAIASEQQAHDGETITYKHVDGRTVVISGLETGNRIFYRKSILSCSDQIWNHVRIEYPAAMKQQFDALVSHVAASLKPGPSAQIPDCRKK